MLSTMSAHDAWGQRYRFPTPTATSVAQGTGVAPGWGTAATPPQTAAPPVPGATLNQGIQPFDPYATVGPPPPLSTPGTAPGWPPPPNTSPLPPSYNPPAYPYSPPGAPSAAYPQQPSSLFPQGLPQTFSWGGAGGPPYQRLFQDTGFTYAYLYGEKENQLQMHDVDISTTLVLQFFAHSGDGLRITPGFTFHFLDGPQPPIPTDTNLPAQLYDAYLDTRWAPRLTPQFSLDLNFRTGVYSDFKKVTTDSIRFMGTGLAVLQLTPTSAIKLGIVYYDRLELKLLPAGGLLWTPNPQTEFDIYFPSPRLAKYWTTVGNSDIWWFLGAEIGGGNWTMERLNDPLMGFTDRVDINDIRIVGGLEWHGLNDRVGFFEVGYVLDREIVFYEVPQDNLKLQDTFMLSAGFRF